MTRDILSEFGKDSNAPQAPRAKHGGEMDKRDVHNYQPPKGPIGITGNERPGLGGVVHPCGSQGPSPERDHDTGHPGIGSTDHGNKGSQR